MWMALQLATSALLSTADTTRASPMQLPALVPWPSNATFPRAPPIQLTASSSILFASDELQSVAAVLAVELDTVHGLKLLTKPGSAPRAQDIWLSIDKQPSRPMPSAPPPSPVKPPKCSFSAHSKLNNTLWADADGPRTTPDAAGCCSLCVQTKGCAAWSFQVDPTVPGKTCHWATLTYCCWMHRDSGSAGPLVHDPTFTSGTLPTEAPMPAVLPAVAIPGWPDTTYTLTSSDSGIVVTAATEAGVLAGTSTLLQATRRISPGAAVVPTMEIYDRPFRGWRGLQLDLHGTPYHSIPMLKKYVDLARFYKINTLTFNLGPSLWLSPVMESTLLMNSTWKATGGSATGCYSHCNFYSASDMRDLVHYGAKKGVRLVPSTGLMPGVSEMVRVLNNSMLPPDCGYKYHDWMDEVDHEGPSTYNGTQAGPGAERFWSFIHVTIARVYKLFAEGWPGGVLPTWHVGAVEGEGGMDGEMLRRFYDAVQAAAVAAHGTSTPAVKVGMYNGISATDPAISNITSNLVAHWYTENFSKSSLKEYLQAGWQVVDISWVPLYIAGDHFSPETVFSLFNLFRASAQQQCDPPSNEQYWVPGRENQTMGAILSTWTAKQPDELGMVREKLGAFAEHVWSYRRWPYPASGVGSWSEFQPRKRMADQLLDSLIGPLIKNYYCMQSTLQCKPMPKFPNGSTWTNGTDWQSTCGSEHGKECCGRPCPGPGAGIVYGGRLFATTGGPSTNMSLNGLSGLRAADAICASQAPTDAALPPKHYKALLADETGCNGKPCRRATITPGVGDGAIDWVIAPNAAYYMLDNSTLVTVSNGTRMLGVANHTKVGGGNQLSPFGAGWVTIPNSTCNNWHWGEPGDFGVTLGSQGWMLEGFQATTGVLPQCGRHDFICVEMASLGPFPPPPPPPPPPSPSPPSPPPQPSPTPPAPKPAPPVPPAPVPAGYVYGGRLWVSAHYNTSFNSSVVLSSMQLNKVGVPQRLARALDAKTGLAAADAICAIEAVVKGILVEVSQIRRYRALLVDEAGCEGKPCRRASITPGVGDGALDWVVAANAAYFKLDNQTLVVLSNSSRMLGKQGNGSAVLGGGNQLAPMGLGWVTLPNSTCNSWQWAKGMAAGPYATLLGSAGWPNLPFNCGNGCVRFPCLLDDFVCIEMAE